jgi:LCP family protein required for cell wall assembly
MPGTLFGGADYHKINAYHEYGGNALAKKAFEGLVGVKIDRVVQIDFDAFQQMVDSAGGVTLKVDRPMDYDDNAGALHIHIKPGVQHMTGETAINFVRYRHGDSDFMRQRRQQQFLMALKDQVGQHPWVFEGVAEIGQKVLGNEFTDDEAIALAFFAKTVQKSDIRFGQAVVTIKPNTTFLYLNRRRTRQVMADLGIIESRERPDAVAESTRPHRKHGGTQ